MMYKTNKTLMTHSNIYSGVPNKHAYPNKHVWWKKIKKNNKSVGAQ